MNISAFKQARPADAVAAFGDEHIAFTYDRAQLTGAIFDNTTRAQRLARTLIRWDVTDDDGAPYQPAKGAPDREAAWLALLNPLPADVLRAVEDALWDDFHAGK